MVISKRRYFCIYWLTMLVVGTVLIMAIPIANNYMYHFPMVNEICKTILMYESLLFVVALLATVICNKGLKNYISRLIILHYVESNLISIGAYIKKKGNYAVLPKIRIKNGTIIISLGNLRIRTIIERYLNSFSTALPERYIVEDYYITTNNAEVRIVYNDIKNYKCEEYNVSDYVSMVKDIGICELYFDKKHIVNVNDYPHYLISGSSGSGKSYLVNELVVQAIVKQWQVVILDLKRSYGLYSAYSDYCFELSDIIDKLKQIEFEMHQRLQKLQPALDNNPRALAVDIGYKPMLVVVEEYVSLLSSLDKKQKEEIERIVKNISVLARQCNIHLMIVMQSAGTENIQSTTRSNLTKVLLGNAQSNILTATFGTGVDIPKINSKLNKGEGLMQLDRISVLRVPRIDDIDNIKEVLF